MAQGYYTLEEAAKLLGMTVDELKLQARRGDIRSFQDRGTWRFRVQDIQELARQRGLGSEPDLVLGESLSPVPKKTSDLKKPSGKSGVKISRTPTPPPSSPEILASDPAEESVGIGQEPLGSGSKSSKKSGPKSGSKSPTPKKSSKLDPPEVGSDSDVRLVNDDPNMDFGIEVDSDVRLAETPPPGKPKSSGRLPGQGKTGEPGADPGKRRRSEVHVSPPDSGVRLVPMDSDSDVRIVGQDPSSEEIPLGEEPPKTPSDSDIRLELDPNNPPDSDNLTEEIDLDAELGKQQASSPPAPEDSPFELSDTDYNLPSTGSSLAPKQEAPSDSGSDFDLTPLGESASPVEPGSDEFDLPLPDDSDEFSLGDSSGDRAVDSGISLEQESEGSDEIDFALNIDDHSQAKTPPPTPAKPDSSEFELSVADDSSSEMSALEESSEFELAQHGEDSSESSPLSDSSPTSDSSEFELTLDMEESSSEFELTIDASGEGEAGPDLASDSEFELQLEDEGLESSSEFELTIDDDLQLIPEDGAAPQVEMEEEVIPTDLDEAPMLEEDTGSDVVALDEDAGLEYGDFEIEVEDESSSAVVALEEEFDEGVAVGDKGVDVEGFDELGEVEGYGEEVAVGEEGPVRRETVVVERDVYAAPWPAWPTVLMLPCVVVMFFIGLMGLELVQSMGGYQEPGPITKAIAGMLQIPM